MGREYHGLTTGAHRCGLRGRHPAADRLNLIRVMPAQGWVARNARQGRRNPFGSTIVPHDITPIGTKRDVLVPIRRTRTRDDGGASLDAIIAGVWTIGLACAWRAPRRALRLRVLERDAPCSGATLVAWGLLAPVG